MLAEDYENFKNGLSTVVEVSSFHAPRVKISLKTYLTSQKLFKRQV